MACPSTHDRLQDRLEEMSATIRDLRLVCSDLSDKHASRRKVSKALFGIVKAIDDARVAVCLHQKHESRHLRP